MKNKLFISLLLVLMVSLLFSCGSNNKESAKETPEAGKEEISDAKEENNEQGVTDEVEDATGEELFISNLSDALYGRWDVASLYTPEMIELMTEQQLEEFYTKLVDAELNVLGEKNDYNFSDEEMDELAEMYFNGLDLQQEGLQYIGTEDYENQAKTWQLGYYYRAAAVSDLYKKYGLSVKNPYKADFADLVSEGKDAKEIIESGTVEVAQQPELPPTVDTLRTDGFIGEINGIKAEMWIVPEASWNDEVVAYRFTNTTTKDLLVGLEYVGYTKEGESMEWGVGHTMYLKGGESGVDYLPYLSDETYYFEYGINTRNADAKTIEMYKTISTEEYIANGEVNYTIHFPDDGMDAFKYIIAYTDEQGRIVSCDSLEGGSGDGLWSDSFIAPEKSYSGFETSLHNLEL